MTPIEEYDGVLVKREDLYSPLFPSAKMRALLPYMKVIKDTGWTTVVAPVGRHSFSPPAIMAAARSLGLDVHIYVNTTPTVELDSLVYAKELGNPHITYRGRCRHHALRTAAQSRVSGTRGSALLPTDCVEPMFFAPYARVVEGLPDEPLTHVVPFLSGSFIAGLYKGLRQAGRRSDHILAVPRLPEAAGENFLARVLQIAYPEKHVLKNTLPDNVVIAKEQRPIATPWPSALRCSWSAWAVALRYRGWVSGRVMFWSLEQGYENKHLR